MAPLDQESPGSSPGGAIRPQNARPFLLWARPSGAARPSDRAQEGQCPVQPHRAFRLVSSPRLAPLGSSAGGVIGRCYAATVSFRGLVLAAKPLGSSPGGAIKPGNELPRAGLLGQRCELEHL